MAPGGGISLVELVVLGWSSAAAPAPIPIRIDFDAPAGCSTAAAFYDALRARTDRVRLATEGERSWNVHVRLSRAGSGVHGELRVIHERGETDTRTVKGASCDTVVQALSLTASLAVDEVVAESAPPVPVAPPPAAPAPREPAPPVDAAREAPPFRLEIGAHAVLTQVVAPHVSFGGALAARMTQQRMDDVFSPSLGVALIHARNDLLQSAGNAAIQWTAAALAACPLRWQITGFLGVQPCATTAVGWLAATGRGVMYPESVVRSWWSAGGLVRAAASFGGGTAVELEAGISAPLVHRRFILLSPEVNVGETPVISPLVGLGITHLF
ncbi:hypothetical protein SOCEGT47_050540 [Sorangium cellulosum]|uniref:Uncharacterized protein n=1 Tax=Sorangium cellulosum TaxID=56 RepID=A0A4P2Q5Z4_SORCE|nr:hypothetical protein [Sorangium cellulosum]AUX24516.1 hypothetical protein SOCEGT47_050540 [Sorangium cellulosum]